MVRRSWLLLLGCAALACGRLPAGQGDERFGPQAAGDADASENGGGDPDEGDADGAGDPDGSGTTGDADGGGAGDTDGATGDTDATGDADGAGDTDGGGAGDADGGDADFGDSDPGSGDVWIEIDYEHRNNLEGSTSADWAYGNSAAFGPGAWAPTGSSWSYIHTPDGGDLVSDPIGGTVLELGCNDRLRLFFGLEELSSFAAATVTFEGRSRATSAPTTADVWNPATGNFAAEFTVDQDWSAETIEVPFDAVAGDGFQAVEVTPVAGACNLALRRVRLTLYGIE